MVEIEIRGTDALIAKLGKVQTTTVLRQIGRAHV